MTQTLATDSGAIRSADVPLLRYADPHAEIVAMRRMREGSSLEESGGGARSLARQSRRTCRFAHDFAFAHDIAFAHDFAQARSRKGAKLRIRSVAKAKG
jgi:hypothetical protein